MNLKQRGALALAMLMLGTYMSNAGMKTVFKNKEQYLVAAIKIVAVPLAVFAVLKATGLPIGSIGLHHNDLAEKDDEAELGYWLGVPYWGDGIIPEAGAAMLRTAFDLGATEIWVRHNAVNHQSRRVIHKLGFTFRFAETERDGETEKEVWYYSIQPE